MPVVVDEVSVESVPPATTPTTRAADQPPPTAPAAPNSPAGNDAIALWERLRERGARVHAH